MRVFADLKIQTRVNQPHPPYLWSILNWSNHVHTSRTRHSR